MNKQILIVVFISMSLMCTLSSCKSNLYDKIGSYIKKNCENKDTCILFLKDITDFEWEQFYYIPNGNYATEILGFDYLFNTDLSEAIVFLREGKIVYHEEVFQHPSKPSKYTFCKTGKSFEIIDYKYLLFTPDEAVFYITEWKDRKNHYLLHPIEPIP